MFHHLAQPAGQTGPTIPTDEDKDCDTRKPHRGGRKAEKSNKGSRRQAEPQRSLGKHADMQPVTDTNHTVSKPMLFLNSTDAHRAPWAAEHFQIAAGPTRVNGRAAAMYR